MIYEVEVGDMELQNQFVILKQRIVSNINFLGQELFWKHGLIWQLLNLIMKSSV